MSFSSKFARATSPLFHIWTVLDLLLCVMTYYHMQQLPPLALLPFGVFASLSAFRLPPQSPSSTPPARLDFAEPPPPPPTRRRDHTGAPPGACQSPSPSSRLFPIVARTSVTPTPANLEYDKPNVPPPRSNTSMSSESLSMSSSSLFLSLSRDLIKRYSQ